MCVSPMRVSKINIDSHPFLKQNTKQTLLPCLGPAPSQEASRMQLFEEVRVVGLLVQEGIQDWLLNIQSLAANLRIIGRS